MARNQFKGISTDDLNRQFQGMATANFGSPEVRRKHRALSNELRKRSQALKAFEKQGLKKGDEVTGAQIRKASRDVGAQQRKAAAKASPIKTPTKAPRPSKKPEFLASPKSQTSYAEGVSAAYNANSGNARRAETHQQRLDNEMARQAQTLHGVQIDDAVRQRARAAQMSPVETPTKAPKPKNSKQSKTGKVTNPNAFLKAGFYDEGGAGAASVTPAQRKRINKVKASPYKPGDSTPAQRAASRPRKVTGTGFAGRESAKADRPKAKRNLVMTPKQIARRAARAARKGR